MHIMDIAENSIKAGADEVDVSLVFLGETLEMTIRDNGCGMDAEMVQKITDPYTTSRTTRKVGLGLPFLKMNAEQTGGKVEVVSAPGEGTTVKAVFFTSNIDCIPLGEVASTLSLLITGNPAINVKVRIQKDEEVYEISSREINDILDGIPISHPKVGVFVKNMLKEEL
ncbi:ATP-binding protein [Marinilabilia rubra]|uniref:histidine kinase n=2 Tax=Marinilabilia rubra TaxID=2162893 RepID=A0A2U2BCX4_9BACT|nr:ATP-binding protein [Marinilabilia rubra]